MKQPAAAAKAFEQALRYDPDYDKARDNLAAARSLMPVTTVVQLPAQPGATPVQMQASLAAPETVEAMSPVAEQLIHRQKRPLALRAGLPAEARAKKSWPSKSLQVPALVSAVRPAQPSKGAPQHIERPSSLSYVASVEIGQIRIFAVLAIFGVMLLMPVMLRWLCHIKSLAERASAL